MNPKFLSSRPRLSDRSQVVPSTWDALRNEDIPPVEFKRQYKDINDVLSHIRLQVLQSVKYANDVLPNMNHPYQLFDWLKERTQYRNDPKGVELLQRMKTLLQGNYWGAPGMGDCDCFSITVLACCNVLGWKSWIKLAGRDLSAPVHIWTGVTWNGKDIALDLTEKVANSERDYKYIQKINFVPV